MESVKIKSTSFFRYMEQTVIRYRKQGQFRTSETYDAALHSFLRFRAGKDLSIDEINACMMEEYEAFLKHAHLTPNTVSFYMKHLRAVYNRAVEDGLVADSKPFRRVYTSVETTAKRALPVETVRQLKTYDCSSSRSRRFARDMFMFSFYTRGMSFVDIAYLKKTDVRGNVLVYRRKKTGQQLSIRLEPCIHEILSEYKAEPSSPYLLSVIKDPKEDTRKQYQNAMFLVNRHLKSIGKELGLNHPLTMYCARHSWASIARDEGIPLSVISEGMGHDSEKTTRIYLASLKTDVIDRANRKILKLL